MANYREKRWVDFSNDHNKLFGVNIGKYPEHHFTHLPSALWDRPVPLQLVICGYDIMCKGVFRQRENCARHFFELVAEGEIDFESNGEIYHCRPGDMFVLRQHSNNRMTCTSPLAKIYCVGFTGTLLQEILAELHLNDLEHIRFESLSPWLERFAAIAESAAGNLPDTSLTAAASGYELLLQLSREIDSRHHQPLPLLLHKITTFLQTNLANPLRMESIAAHFKVSQSTIFMLFRKHLKITPMEFTTRIRMEHAARLLTVSELPIKEIAARCGYESQIYFSQAFKNYFRIAPKNYRKGRCQPEKSFTS